MDSKLTLSFLFFLLVSLSCEEANRKIGSVVRIDYQGAKIKGGEWVQIDSFRFSHIEKRSDAKNMKYPIPSSKVIVDSGIPEKRKRDYNPKTFPIYISENIQIINKKIPKKEEYLIKNRFLMSYKGILKIVKKDSSKISVKTSKEYSAKVSVK